MMPPSRCIAVPAAFALLHAEDHACFALSEHENRNSGY